MGHRSIGPCCVLGWAGMLLRFRSGSMQGPGLARMAVSTDSGVLDETRLQTHNESHSGLMRRSFLPGADSIGAPELDAPVHQAGEGVHCSCVTVSTAGTQTSKALQQLGFGLARFVLDTGLTRLDRRSAVTLMPIDAQSSFKAL